MNNANEADNAEISWRTGFCIRFKAALAIDLINRYGEEIRNYTLSMAEEQYEEASLMRRFTDSLESRQLRIHPLVCGKTEIIQVANQCMARCGPATCYEIHRYLNMNKPSVDLLKAAYVAAPWSRRLRYEYCSAKLFNIQAVVTMDSLCEEKPWWTAEKIYFTTHTGMAIGHYSIVVDFLELCLRETWNVEIWIIQTGSDVDFGVRSLLMRKYPNIRFCKASIVEGMSLQELTTLQDAHFRHYWMNSQERVRTYQTIKEIRRNKHISMHLRSSLFRNDSKNPATNIRSVSQSNYQKAVNSLVNANYTINQITAEAKTVGLNKTRLINVTTMPFKVQWEAIENSDFIFGTPSGISHFSALTSFATLMTNWTGMPSENILGEYSLVACKRFSPKKRTIMMSRAELLSLFINFWVDDPIGFGDYVVIRELNESEICAATEEYIKLLQGDWGGETLHEIIIKNKVQFPTKHIQNWKLSRATSQDLQLILDSSVEIS